MRKKKIFYLVLGLLAFSLKAQAIPLKTQIAAVKTEYRSTVFETDPFFVSSISITRIVVYCGPFSFPFYRDLYRGVRYHPYYHRQSVNRLRSERIRDIAYRGQNIPPAVPEPATMAMLAGVGMLMGLKRFRRKGVNA